MSTSAAQAIPSLISLVKRADALLQVPLEPDVQLLRLTTYFDEAVHVKCQIEAYYPSVLKEEFFKMFEAVVDGCISKYNFRETWDTMLKIESDRLRFSVGGWYSISGNQILDALEVLPPIRYHINNDIQMSSAPFTPNVAPSKEVQTVPLSSGTVSASASQGADIALEEESPARDTCAVSPSTVSSADWVMPSPVVAPSGAFIEQFAEKEAPVTPQLTSSSNVRASDPMRVNISRPSMPKFTAPSTAQRTGQSSTIQGKVTPRSMVNDNTGPSDSTEAFQKDWSSPLHSKPTQRFPVGPPVQATRPEVPTTASSHALAVDAASHPTVIRGPDPNLGPLREDDEEEQIQEDLVTGGAALFEDDGFADNISNLDDDEPVPPQDDPMDLDKDEPPSDDEEMSPPPTNIAHRLRQEPRISFVFDEITGDFVESYPTIFLPRPTVPPASSQDLCHSARSRGSPVNPDATYLKAVLGSKVDAKKNKNKDAKGKDRATEAKAPHKRTRTEDNTTPLKDKPPSKKPKLKETIIIDEDERMAQDFQDRRLLL
ncbi:hypothetical protein ARMGADRAFT_1088736 [Armillaria gallica]|uniref:Uncharacterized protein n=1 Tax=Armillaria gallica TaxID=47427 RepID=A0A2H3CLX0_ARMGA|nr:hypothetical protein ARMGADRAFT_1088736 [Armillaria gallica]